MTYTEIVHAHSASMQGTREVTISDKIVEAKTVKLHPYATITYGIQLRLASGRTVVVTRKSWMASRRKNGRDHAHD